MLTCTPSLAGVEAGDAREVTGYLRSQLGLDGGGQLASTLEACPPMLMYHAWDNLRKKVGEGAGWSVGRSLGGLDGVE